MELLWEIEIIFITKFAQHLNCKKRSSQHTIKPLNYFFLTKWPTDITLTWQRRGFESLRSFFRRLLTKAARFSGTRVQQLRSSNNNFSKSNNNSSSKSNICRQASLANLGKKLWPPQFSTEQSQVQDFQSSSFDWFSWNSQPSVSFLIS